MGFTNHDVRAGDRGQSWQPQPGGEYTEIGARNETEPCSRPSAKVRDMAMITFGGREGNSNPFGHSPTLQL